MKHKTAELIMRLSHLCAEYGATLGYTSDDDGIHVSCEGEDVCIGFDIEDYATARSVRELSGMVNGAKAKK